MSEAYKGYDGKELLTPKGEVITVPDVASEAVKHAKDVTMDSQGRVVFPMEGNYKLAVDANEAMNSEWYATKDGSIEGPRKINSVKFHREANPAKSQIIGVENDYKPEKGNVGEVGPLVVKTSKGTWVAVQDAVRFGIHYKEAFRRGWNRPAEEAPQVKAKLDKIKVEKYTDEQLGMVNSNNARLVAPDGRKAFISHAMTVLTVPGSKRPKVEGATWMRLERFLTVGTEEGIGKGAVDAAVRFGYLSTDQEKIEKYKGRMANHVRKAKAAEMAKGAPVAEVQK